MSQPSWACLRDDPGWGSAACSAARALLCLSDGAPPVSLVSPRSPLEGLLAREPFPVHPKNTAALWPTSSCGPCVHLLTLPHPHPPARDGVVGHGWSDCPLRPPAVGVHRSLRPLHVQHHRANIRPRVPGLLAPSSADQAGVPTLVFQQSPKPGQGCLQTTQPSATSSSCVSRI